MHGSTTRFSGRRRIVFAVNELVGICESPVNDFPVNDLFHRRTKGDIPEQVEKKSTPGPRQELEHSAINFRAPDETSWYRTSPAPRAIPGRAGNYPLSARCWDPTRPPRIGQKTAAGHPLRLSRGDHDQHFSGNGHSLAIPFGHLSVHGTRMQTFSACAGVREIPALPCGPAGKPTSGPKITKRPERPARFIRSDLVGVPPGLGG